VAQIISFGDQAVARLRERLGAVEEAHVDLIAFARGHWDAVASINAATLAAIEAPSIDALFDVIARRWPDILGIDHVAIGLVVGNRGFLADCDSIERVEPAFVQRMVEGAAPVEVRAVDSGHPLFGPTARPAIRAEALIRIDGPAPYPHGLLALGQNAELAADSDRGSAMLQFLGKVVASTIRRCVATA
jgi:uncharacterized protein YigA (DUF484 family)